MIAAVEAATAVVVTMVGEANGAGGNRGSSQVGGIFPKLGQPARLRGGPKEDRPRHRTRDSSDRAGRMPTRGQGPEQRWIPTACIVSTLFPQNVGCRGSGARCVLQTPGQVRGEPQHRGTSEEAYRKLYKHKQGFI